MIIEIVILCLGILALLIGTYTDLKIREIPDFVSFTLIISCVILRLIYSIINNEWSFLILGLIALTMGFVFGLLMNYLGQWGGGDAKLLMGLFVAFATTPIFFKGNLFFNFNFSFITILLFNIFFVGAIYSLLYSIALVILNYKKFEEKIKINFEKNKTIYRFTYIISIIIVGSSFLFSEIAKLFLIFIPLLIFLFANLILYIKSVEESCFIKEIPVDKLREGDWVQDEIKIKNKLVYSKKECGITKEKIKLIQKNKIKKVTVKEGIPFIPAFLMAFIVTFFIGNWLFLILI